MDRPSAIPRPKSRLPLPASSFGRSLKASPSRERLNADTGLDVRRLHRPSQESLRRKASYPLANLSEDIDEGCDGIEQSDGWLSSPRGFSIDEAEPLDHVPYQSDRSFDIAYRGPPPAHSPRSISRSSLYSRPASIQEPFIDSSDLSNADKWSNAGSTSSGTLNPNRLSVGQSSALRKTSSSRKVSPSSPRSVSQKRVTLNGPPPRSPSSNRSSILAAQPKSPRIQRQKSRPFSYAAPADPDIGDDRSDLTHHAPPRITSSHHPPPKKSTAESTSRKPSGTTQKKKVVRKPPPVLPTHDTDEDAKKPAHNPGKSSNALRESIAKAKAAARQAAKRSQSQSQNDFHDGSPVEPGDPDAEADLIDPFNQAPKGPEAQKLVLKKKANIGRTTGTLNIAGLGLKDIPEEILRMYDFDPEDSGNWAESVDLIRLVAADNEFEFLPDAAFPDVNPMDAMEGEEVEGNFQFLGLEHLDLHNNSLNRLPVGLKRLERLRTLNMSKNSLPMDIFDLIAQIPNLTELRIANNGLSGTLSASVGDLRQLEVLDVRGNALSALCDEITSLTSLHVLDISDNALTSLPTALFTNVPLLELNAKNNKLRGDLIPAPVTSISRLQTLNVTGNALTGLSASEELSLPSLRQLLIGGNRITTLPDVSSWKQLLNIIADSNHLTSLPEGFTELSSLKIADFTANDIKSLPVKIGLMDSLANFTIANNPLSEKRYLTMDTEQMILDMRAKCEPLPRENDSDDESVQTFFTLPDESTTPTPSGKERLQLKAGGVLDLSNHDLDDATIARIEDLAKSSEIRIVQLSRASIQSFPIPVLSAVANSVVEIDLSHNLLKSQDLLPTALYLPSLKVLNLSHTGLTDVECLLMKLSAPSLEILDISNNRLTGKLPLFKEIFPSLLHLFVADNRFESLAYESVNGLRSLDITNNDINSLPPRIGLLGGDGGLQRFDVAGNTFRVPRWQVVEKGTTAILEWLKRAIPEDQLREWGVEDVDDVY